MIVVLFAPLILNSPLTASENDLFENNSIDDNVTEIVPDIVTHEPEPESYPEPDYTSYKNTSTFTCYGRITGYYADVKLGCRVYHFCTQMDTIGETAYQRMSYICLEGAIFDQKDLNCVKESDLKVPCNQAEAEYEASNKQFDSRDESSPSMSDSLAANLMMNPLTRFFAGR